jgi:zinc and cadmium transporter
LETSIPYPLLGFTFFVTMLGGCLSTFKSWAPNKFELIINFCAGNFIGAVLFHMIPDAKPILGFQMVYPMVVGFFSIYGIEKTLGSKNFSTQELVYQKMGLSALMGISFHSFVEGFAMGAATLMNVGFVVIAAIIFHKFPIAMALSSLFIKAGKYDKKTIISIIFVFALTTPLGVLLAFGIFGVIDKYWLGVAIAVSAGTFIYLAFFDLMLIGNKQKGNKTENMISLGLGILAMFLFKN